MAGEVDQAVQQEQPAKSPPQTTPAGESQDVEMTDAPAMAKTPGQVTSVAPGNPPAAAEPPASEPAPVVEPVEAPKGATLESSSAPEPAQSEPLQGEGAKPTETAAAPVETAPPAGGPVQKLDAAAEEVQNKQEVALDEGVVEKPTETLLKPSEAAATDSSTAQIAEDVDVAKKPQAAEDAGVKMLASSLEPPVNGTSSETAQLKQPEESATQAKSQAESQVESHADKPPVTGDKRKADDSVEANGDASSKKVVLEDAPAAPTTNGSPPPRKAGRPKKDKKQLAPVGRTARRTRSQGAADV